MGCGDACPIYPGKRYEDGDLRDPAGSTLEQAREVRGEIDARVRHLLTEILRGWIHYASQTLREDAQRIQPREGLGAQTSLELEQYP
ncbi:hypothetical protein GCM10009625_00500 [Brachybacterium fresconis]